MIQEDYFEQFCAKTPEEARAKTQAAADRAREKGMTFPQLTHFPEHACEFGDLFVFQAWRVAPPCGEAAPAHPALQAAQP